MIIHHPSFGFFRTFVDVRDNMHKNWYMVNRLYLLIFYYDFPHRRPISEIAQTYKRGCSEGGKPNSRFYLAICREKKQQKASGVKRSV